MRVIFEMGLVVVAEGEGGGLEGLGGTWLF